MYIVFEGMVGSGKSTQSKRLQEALQKKYPEKEIILVREPGSTPIAEDIRTLSQAKDWKDDVMQPLTDAYLPAAARAQLLHSRVKPCLDRGGIVIADRSFVSSLAYQGYAQGLGFETILSINHEAIKGILPDMILFMEIDIATALSRTFDAKGDKWERKGQDFFEKIQEGYRASRKLPILVGRGYTIDAHQEKEAVFQAIWQVISQKLSV